MMIVMEKVCKNKCWQQNIIINKELKEFKILMLIIFFDLKNKKKLVDVSVDCLDLRYFF